MANISAEQRGEYEAVFRAFDKEGKGSLTVEECAIAMRAMGYDLPSNQLQQCDVNGFIHLVCSVSQHLVDKEPMLNQALRCFDAQGQGWADMQQLQWAMTSIGEPLNGQEWQQFQADCQAQQGQVSIDAFAKRLMFKQ